MGVRRSRWVRTHGWGRGDAGVEEEAAGMGECTTAS